MATAKKTVAAARNDLKSAIAQQCHEHATVAHAGQAKATIDFGSLVTKVEAIVVAACPTVIAGLQVADQLSTGKLKALIEAAVLVVNAGSDFLATEPAPAA